MKNQIYHITKDELESVRQRLSNENGIWIAEIDGKKIKTWKNYADAIENVFCFPAHIVEFHIYGLSMDGYLDWMRDLSWLNTDGFVLFITNFEDFMKNDIVKKEKIIKYFNEDVLPWWEHEIIQYQVGGKPKPFNVYLVD